MIFSTLYGTALDIELASSDRTVLFTTARRKSAINDAQDAFARLTGCTRRVGTKTPLTDGTNGTEYLVDLEAEFTDFVRLDGAPSLKIVSGTNIRYIQGREDFPRHDRDELDRIDPGWLAASAGTPSSWYVKEDGGATNLGLTPPPDVISPAVWSLIVPYIADPADMTSDSAEPFTFSANVLIRLRPYHQALVHYAAAVLEPLRKNYTGVTRQMQIYTGFVAQYLQQRRQDGPDQITLARDYYSDSARSTTAEDPRSWP